MDKGTAETDILCFSPDDTLWGQQKNRPANIGAGVLAFLMTNNHFRLPVSILPTPLIRGNFAEPSAWKSLVRPHFSRLRSKKAKSATIVRRLLLKDIILDIYRECLVSNFTPYHK